MNTVVMHPKGVSHVFGPVMQYPDTWQPGVCFIYAGAVLPTGLSQDCFLGAGGLAGCLRGLQPAGGLIFALVTCSCFDPLALSQGRGGGEVNFSFFLTLTRLSPSLLSIAAAP